MNAGSNAFTDADPNSGIVRGTAPTTIVLDPRPCPLAPNFSKTGYKPTFFANQNHDFSKQLDNPTTDPGEAAEDGTKCF